MRILPPLIWASTLAACSGAPDPAANTVDVAAAAARGQSDIANYAADAGSRRVPRAVSTPAAIAPRRP